MRCKIQFISIFLILQVTSSFAQYPYTSRISAPDPLPTPIIYDMMTDSKGYIWLATDKGLIRFNSRKFQVLPFENTSSKSVGYIQESADGVIWCTNFYKQLFFVKNDTLRLFEVKSPVYEKLNNILNIAVADSSVYVGSFNKILKINRRTKTVEQKISTNESINILYQHLVMSGKQLFVFANNNTLINANDTSYKFKSNKVFVEIRMVAGSGKILGIERGNRDRRAILFDGQKITDLPDFALPADAYAYHVCKTGIDEFWICTQNGAYKWDYPSGKTELFFPNERVSDIVKDFQGNYWISTLDNGLLKCPNLHCRQLPLKFRSGNNIATRLIVLPGKNILAGNARGEIAEFDQRTTASKNYPTVTKDEIEFLNFDVNNQMLFSDGGLIDYSTGKLISAIDFGKAIDRDKNGNIIMATFNRCLITKSDFNTIDTVSVPGNIALYKNLSSTIIGTENKRLKKALVLRKKRCAYVLAAQGKQGFWVAYEDGLYSYQYNGKIHGINDENQKPIIASHLIEMPGGRLLVSTTFNGIFILKNDSIIQHFRIQNGLHGNTYKKAFFSNDTIWALSDESLDIIDLKTRRIEDFYTNTGLESLNVYDFAISGTNIYLATAIGILYYNSSLKTNSNEIRINGLRVESFGSVIEANQTLPYDKNEVSLTIDALHYKAPSKLLIYYRLKGKNDNWQFNDASNNKIWYVALSPGIYTVEVYATDVNKTFRSSIQKLTFTIDKPFWLKTWFISLSLIFFSIIIWCVWIWWARRFKSRQTIKERLLKSELVAIRSQMNPHFLYNVLNTVQGLVYANRKAEAGDMLGNFSDLMRKTLEESDSTAISLKKETESLALYLELEKKRFDKDFEYHIVIDPFLDSSNILIPPMLIQPFAENAIKHGLLHKSGSKHLKIDIRSENNYLIMVVEDNGIGRKASIEINKSNKNKSAGFAVKATEERIALFNELNARKIIISIIDKTDEKGEAAGTIVQLTLPIS